MKSEKKTPVFNISHYLLGLRFDNWIRLLWRARFQIDPKKLPQVLLITVLSLILLPFAILETLICVIPVSRTKIRKQPIYILGHWRSGTTFLHDLISQDPQFGWPNPLQTLLYSNCVLLGWFFRGFMKRGLKNARPFDNVQYQMNLPVEETFCVGKLTPYSISHLMVFPNVWQKYIPGAFVDDLQPWQRKEFKRVYARTVKKFTWLQHGKQMVMKSPDNTAHIGALLELYPDAKFVNIYRNPYDTVLSTVNMYKSQLNLLRLSIMPKIDLDDFVEDIVVDHIFSPMYRDLFQREKKFASGHFVNIKYEDFVQEPEHWLKYIYDTLNLGGFQDALPRFRQFIAGQKDYQKNHHIMRPELQKKINERLGFYFEHYGYEMQPLPITDAKESSHNGSSG